MQVPLPPSRTPTCETELHLKAFPVNFHLPQQARQCEKTSICPCRGPPSLRWRGRLAWYKLIPASGFEMLRGNKKTRSLFKFWWSCHSPVNIPKALDTLHRNSGAVSNTKLWRAHLCWQFNWLLFEFVKTDYADITWSPATLRNSPKGSLITLCL